MDKCVFCNSYVENEVCIPVCTNCLKLLSLRENSHIKIYRNFIKMQNIRIRHRCITTIKNKMTKNDNRCMFCECDVNEKSCVQVCNDCYRSSTRSEKRYIKTVKNFINTIQTQITSRVLFGIKNKK